MIRDVASPLCDVYLSGPSSAGRVQVRVLTPEIQAMAAWPDWAPPEAVNTLSWPFVGAAERARCLLLVDLEECRRLAATADSGLSLSFGNGGQSKARVRLFPRRIWPIQWNPIAENLSNSALAVLELTDARGAFIDGSWPNVADAEHPQAPEIVNETRPEHPLHVVHSDVFVASGGVDAASGQSVQVPLQAANARDTCYWALQRLAIAGASSANSGAAEDGTALPGGPLVSLDPLVPGWPSIAALPAPFDLAVPRGAELRVVDSLAARWGHVVAFLPAWTSGGVTTGTAPLDGSGAIPGNWAARVAAALAAPDFGGEGLIAGAWESLPFGGLPAPPESVIRAGLQQQQPGMEGPAAAGARTAASDLPVAVRVSFRAWRGSTRALAGSGAGSLLIGPAGLVDGMTAPELAKRAVDRRWDYQYAIGPDLAPVDPSSLRKNARVVRLHLADPAILDGGSQPLNSAARSGTILDSYYGCGTIESLAVGAARAFYSRWLSCCGRSLHSGLVVLDSSDWWPGIQRFTWRFAREGELPSTLFEGSTWNTALGWQEAAPGAVGGSSGESPAGWPQIRSSIERGSSPSWLSSIVAVKPWRTDPATGDPIACLYLVQPAIAPDPDYGRRNASAPESALSLDPSSPQRWVPNLRELRNTSLVQGNGVDTAYPASPTEFAMKMKPLPVGPCHLRLAPSIEGGGWWYIDEWNAYSVTCSQQAASAAQSSSANEWREYEADLGDAATSGKFNLIDERITPDSIVVVVQSPGPYTGKGTLADEAAMDRITATAESRNGYAVVHWSSLSGFAARQPKESQPFIGLSNRILQTYAARSAVFAIGRVKGNVKFRYQVQ